MWIGIAKEGGKRDELFCYFYDLSGGDFFLFILSGINGWLLPVGAAFLLAVILNEYVKLEARVEELEKRLPKEEEDNNKN